MDCRQLPQLRNGFLAALAYVATTWLCIWLLKHPLHDAAIGWRALVGLLPLLPIALAVRVVVNLVLAGDELQRRIDLEAMAVASITLGLGALTLSLLLIAQVVSLSARQALAWVFPALWLGYAAARLWAARRYR